MMFTAKVRIKNSLGGSTLSVASALPKKGARVKVSFPAGESDAGNIQKAIWNEFGTRGSGKRFKTEGRGGKTIGGFGGPIPERPFMRSAMRDNEAKYRANMVVAGQHIIEAIAKGGDSSAELQQALRNLGILAVGDIQDSILTWTTPPNSPLTIEIKGANAPLRDTGQMHAAVTWKVDGI